MYPSIAMRTYGGGDREYRGLRKSAQGKLTRQIFFGLITHSRFE